MLTSALLIVVALATPQNQPQHPVFKKGDRVLASPLSLKDEKYWRTCTVTDVQAAGPKRAYAVTCDPQTAGGAPSSFTVGEDWVKPLTGERAAAAPAPAPQSAPQRSAAVAGSAPAAGGTVACPSEASDVKTQSALESAFKSAIRKGFEREPAPGADGRVTVTFQALTVGASHPYRVYEDPNDAKGKTIYPVRATFTACTDYNRRIQLVKRERMFACYTATSGTWTCDAFAAANTNVKDETKSIDKPR